MECRKEITLKKCNCTYEPCSRKGSCCECVSYHLNMRELPACYFDSKDERIYDRSIEFFVRLNR
jgi:hypothetical protein